MKLTPFEKVIRLLERWNSDELKRLQGWLSIRIEQLESLTEELELPPVKSGREAVSICQLNSMSKRYIRKFDDLNILHPFRGDKYPQL